MAKYGYTCLCGGFNLKRGGKTRKVYAMAKVEHAASCELMKNELADSKKVLNTGSKRVAASAE